MIKAALKTLLDRLDAIGQKDTGLTDTEVRDLLKEAIYNGFILRTPGYEMPTNYLLYNAPECNAQVRSALSDFIKSASPFGPASPEDRFRQFQDASVRSDAGHSFNFYFGAAASLDRIVAVPV